MGKTNRSKGNKKIDPTVLVALITGVVAIIVAVITKIGNHPQSPDTPPATTSTPIITFTSAPIETITSIPSLTPTKPPDLVFGPGYGILDASNKFIFRPSSPTLQVHNSIFSIVFVNPVDADSWTYTIYFRDQPGIQSNSFTICNCGTWSLYANTPEKGTYKLYDGTIKNLNISREGSNHIRLVVKDAEVAIIVNQTPISDANLMLDADLGLGGFAITSSPNTNYSALQILSLDEK